MSYEVVLHGGPADGSWFNDHQLPSPPPDVIRVAVGGVDGVALLDLPDDVLEIGEHVVVYAYDGPGHICIRSGPEKGCHSFAQYAPVKSELAALRNRRPRRESDLTSEV